MICRFFLKLSGSGVAGILWLGFLALEIPRGLQGVHFPSGCWPVTQVESPLLNSLAQLFPFARLQEPPWAQAGRAVILC